jgi:hypothetical protein
MGDPKAFRLAAYSMAQSSAAWAIPNAWDAIPIRPESGNQKISSMSKIKLHDSCLPRCNTVLLGGWFPMFQRYSPQSIRTLIMNAILPFTTQATSHPTMQCHTPEHHNPHSHYSENLKTHTKIAAYLKRNNLISVLLWVSDLS